jgi:FkbM family methyltransferase
VNTLKDSCAILREELDSLLCETVEAAYERERTAFDRVAGSFSEGVVLFGAGGMGRRTLRGIRLIGMSPVAFADNNPNIHGQRIDGVPVLSPEQAASQYGRSAVFLVTIWGSLAKDGMRERITFLQDMGCKFVMPAGLLFWKFPNVFLPYFPMDLPHKALLQREDILQGFGVFKDNESQEEFIGQMRFRLLLDFDRMGYPKGPDAYFREDLFESRQDEVFVDCGAFDGDTIADFLRIRGSRFKEIVAFEPDGVNIAKLRTRLSALDDKLKERISIFPNALGAERGVAHFSSTGSDQSRIGQGTEPIEIVTLDDTLADKCPTFLKFDIEGAEPQALLGARQIIRRFRPVLAVSVYHEQSHLWQIPLLLAKTCSDYTFYLRPHGAEGWDLLCYATPNERRA